MKSNLIPYEKQSLKKGQRVLVEMRVNGYGELQHDPSYAAASTEVPEHFVNIKYIVNNPNTSFDTAEPGWHKVLARMIGSK